MFIQCRNLSQEAWGSKCRDPRVKCQSLGQLKSNGRVISSETVCVIQFWKEIWRFLHYIIY